MSSHATAATANETPADVEPGTTAELRYLIKAAAEELPQLDVWHAHGRLFYGPVNDGALRTVPASRLEPGSERTVASWRWDVHIDERGIFLSEDTVRALLRFFAAQPAAALWLDAVCLDQFNISGLHSPRMADVVACSRLYECPEHRPRILLVTSEPLRSAVAVEGAAEGSDVVVARLAVRRAAAMIEAGLEAMAGDRGSLEQVVAGVSSTSEGGTTSGGGGDVGGDGRGRGAPEAESHRLNLAARDFALDFLGAVVAALQDGAEFRPHPCGSEYWERLWTLKERYQLLARRRVHEIADGAEMGRSAMEFMQRQLSEDARRKAKEQAEQEDRCRDQCGPLCGRDFSGKASLQEPISLVPSSSFDLLLWYTQLVMDVGEAFATCKIDGEPAPRLETETEAETARFHACLSGSKECVTFSMTALFTARESLWTYNQLGPEMLDIRAALRCVELIMLCSAVCSADAKPCASTPLVEPTGSLAELVSAACKSLRRLAELGALEHEAQALDPQQFQPAQAEDAQAGKAFQRAKALLGVELLRSSHVRATVETDRLLVYNLLTEESAATTADAVSVAVSMAVKAPRQAERKDLHTMMHISPPNRGGFHLPSTVADALKLIVKHVCWSILGPASDACSSDETIEVPDAAAQIPHLEIERARVAKAKLNPAMERDGYDFDSTTNLLVQDPLYLEEYENPERLTLVLMHKDLHTHGLSYKHVEGRGIDLVYGTGFEDDPDGVARAVLQAVTTDTPHVVTVQFSFRYSSHRASLWEMHVDFVKVKAYTVNIDRLHQIMNCQDQPM
eukprot:gene941-1456_t